jgi:hypothetical protein
LVIYYLLFQKKERGLLFPTLKKTKIMMNTHKLSWLFISIFFLIGNIALAQNIGINDDGSTPEASAILHIKSVNGDKGLLIPEADIADLTTASPVTSPAQGLMVYNTNTTTGEGFHYWDGTEWLLLQKGEDIGTFENTAGVVKNSGTDATDDFVFGSPQLNDDGIVNHRSRFFFDKSKGAFRAGYASTQWNADNVGDYSTAMGYFTEASGEYSTAMGEYTYAGGAHSTAMGEYTYAASDYSTAMGKNTDASGEYSTAMGYFTKAIGDYSTAMGLGTTANDAHSTAMGQDTEASGAHSTAMGAYTEAIGAHSTAMGQDTEASGAHSTAMGQGTYAGGAHSTAMGEFTTAVGAHSTAMGQDTYASGEYSTAMGKDTEAIGDFSMAMGESTRASGAYSTAMGRYNIGGGSSNIWIEADPLFEIGNGTSNLDRSNALTVLKNGKVGIGRIPLTNKLEVEGQASKTSPGDWISNSDARLKKNIEQLNSQSILEKLLALRGVQYEWNDDKTGYTRPEGIQYGFTAQNVQEVFPELVQEDNLGYLQTAYGTYDAMYIEALRELNNQVEKLQSENEMLKTQLSEVAMMKAELELIKVMLKEN